MKITSRMVGEPVREHTLVVNDAELQQIERALFHDDTSQGAANYSTWSRVEDALVENDLRSTR